MAHAKSMLSLQHMRGDKKEMKEISLMDLIHLLAQSVQYPHYESNYYSPCSNPSFSLFSFSKEFSMGNAIENIRGEPTAN